MSLTVTILGCGSSTGVPRVGGGWGMCNPHNPKNRRRRCSILVDRANEDGGKTQLLVDTGPDLREQLLAAEVKKLDAVLYTHEHADHTHGVDDLRALFMAMGHRIHAFADQRTADLLCNRFSYCFTTPPGSSYPPILKMHLLDEAAPISFNGDGGEIQVLPIRIKHGETEALGFRFAVGERAIAYIPDVNSVPDEACEHLRDLDVMIVDALRYKPHVSHFCVDEALDLIAKIKPKRAILTDLHADLDYDELSSRLPAGVEPAYDGLHFTLAT